MPTTQPDAAKKAPKEPRKRGSGGIHEMRPGVWRVSIEAPASASKGRRRSSVVVHGERWQAEAALADLRGQAASGDLPIGSTVTTTVNDLFSMYLAAADAGVFHLAPRSIITARSARNKMCGTRLPGRRNFGELKYAKVTEVHVEALYREMTAAGASPGWVRRCATVLVSVFKFAKRNKLIAKNPAIGVELPELVRVRPFSPTQSALMALVDQVNERDPEMADAVLVLAVTGMRKAEYLGLRWEHINFDQGVLHVDGALTDAGPGKGVVRKEPKTGKWREVPLNKTSIAALGRQHQRMADRWQRPPAATDFVFPNLIDPQRPQRPDTFGHRWQDVRGSSPITLHHLRHFTATTMLDKGFDYRDVSEVLGNSETTLRHHYDGRTNTRKREAMDSMDLGRD